MVKDRKQQIEGAKTAEVSWKRKVFFCGAPYRAECVRSVLLASSLREGMKMVWSIFPARAPPPPTFAQDTPHHLEQVHRDQSTQTIVYWSLECSGEAMSHPWYHTDAKTGNYHAQTAPNTAANHQLVVVFGQMLASAAPILHRAFSYPNTRERYIQHVSWISLWCQLSRSTSHYGYF